MGEVLRKREKKKSKQKKDDLSACELGIREIRELGRGPLATSKLIER